MTDTLYTGDRPFALDTFIPTIRVHGIAAPLPFEIYDQPSNMRFYPKTGAITLSKDQTFLGALE